MTIRCPGCKLIILREDKRHSQPFSTRNGSTLILDANQAPKVRCVCGKVVVILKASL